MSGLEKDTIGGFNSMLEKQRKEAGEVYVSTVLFDNEIEVISEAITQVCACTPLKADWKKIDADYKFATLFFQSPQDT